MKADTSELYHYPIPRKRIIVIFDADKGGELLDMLVGAGAHVDLVGFVAPWQVAYIDRIMQNDNNYLPQ